jgi:glycerol-3-phosphate O-acyltransferase
LDIAVVHSFLRNSGAFFMRRSFKGDPLYKSIFYEYVQTLLSNNHSLEFFLEGTRARSGKMLSPKFGLLKVLTDTYFAKKVENLYFVPTTINYSRVLEGETFPLELLGESKVKESLSRIINAARFLSTNFGSIYIEFTQPISFKNYIQELIVKEGLNPTVNKEDQKLVTSNLGWHIVRVLSDNVIVMPTSIVASMLLMHRKGITNDDLDIQVDFLIKLLRKRNVKLTAHSNKSSICIQKAIEQLGESVGKKKDYFEPKVVPKVDYKNILLLAYYRNNLIHVFINEAIIAISLFGYGIEKAWNEGVSRNDLWDKVVFVSTLLRNEFVLTTNFKTITDYNIVLDLLLSNNTLKELDDGNLVITPSGENHINYLNSLIWPFIDTYWVTFTFIFSLIPSKFIRETEMFEKIQWFAESLYEDQIISFYESCSQEVIKNAVGIYHSDGIIVKQKLETIADGVKDPTIYTFGDKYNDEEKMQKFLDKLSHYRKPTLVKMSNMNNIRKSLLSDFPFMAKI